MIQRLCAVISHASTDVSLTLFGMLISFVHCRDSVWITTHQNDTLIIAMFFRSRLTTGECTLHVPSTRLSGLSHPRSQLEPFPPPMHSIVFVPLFPPSHRLIQSTLCRCLETCVTRLFTASCMVFRGSLLVVVMQMDPGFFWGDQDAVQSLTSYTLVYILGAHLSKCISFQIITIA